MKTNGAVLCVEDLRLAAHRRLPLSASASKKKIQEWRKSRATMEGKRCEQVGKEQAAVKWTGDGAGGEGPGSGGAVQGRRWVELLEDSPDPWDEARFHRRTGSFMGSHRQTPGGPLRRVGSTPDKTENPETL